MWMKILQASTKSYDNKLNFVKYPVIVIMKGIRETERLKKYIEGENIENEYNKLR